MFPQRSFVFPMDLRVGAAAFQDSAHEASGPEPDVEHFRRVLRSSVRNGLKLVPVALAIPPRSKWPAIDADTDDFDIVFQTGSMKDLAFFVRRDRAVVDMVVKLPLTASTAAGCEREFEVLTALADRHEAIAPRPLKKGHLSSSDGTRVQPFLAQSFVPGRQPDRMTFRAFYSFLTRLQLNDQVVRLLDLAEGLKTRVEYLNVDRESRERLYRLLELVTDRTALPAAIGHGDCSAKNLIVTQDGSLVGLDWEFAHTPWLGVLDLVQTTLIEEYLKPGTENFEQAFVARKLAVLHKYRANFLPPKRPGWEQILALHFCQHYIDRVESYGGVEHPHGRRLDNILRSEWPGFIVATV